MTPTCQKCGNTVGSSMLGGLCAPCVFSTAIEDDQAPASASPAPGPGRLGQYELLEEIGRGGMGVVYRARQLSLNRQVALKVLLSGRHADPETLHRFKTEAEAAAALQHPNIVAIHETGEIDGLPYLTMDFVAGRNLAQECDGKPLSAEIAAEMTRVIARAVQHAHEHGVLHRDLKPSNVLLDSEGRPRVSDFGLAKRLTDRDDLTTTGLILGSPNFAPPEQAAGNSKGTGVAADIYGTGAVLYYLLTGRPPFLAGTPTATLQLVIGSEPIGPRELNPAIPRDLETICLKCLEKDPARRYSSAAALADELERFLLHKPILARPVSAWTQTWRWCRRHPAAATLATTTFAALAVTSLVFFIAARRIEVARGQERTARVSAEENFYSANMREASTALTTMNPDLRDVRERLDAVRPVSAREDLRGFEWRYLWKASRGEAVAALEGHQQVVTGVMFSRDETCLASLTIDHTLRIWDAKAYRVRQALAGVSQMGGFSKDGSLVFSKLDGSIWRLGGEPSAPVRLTESTGRLIGLNSDGENVVIFGPDNLPRAVSLSHPMPAASQIEIPIDTCVALARSGSHAAVAGRIYAGIVVMDLRQQRQIALLADQRPVIGLALSPDGTVVVSAGFDGVIKVWDAASGQLEREFRAFLDPIWGLDFSPDGQHFVAGGNNRVLKIWSTREWKLEETLTGHEDTVWAVAFSPDGRRLISGGQDESAFVWSLDAPHAVNEARRLLRGPDWGARTPHLAFSPDGRLFAGTAADGTLKVWRTDSVIAVATFKANPRTVAFSADGSEVLGEDYDGTIRRWRLADGELRETRTPTAHFTNWSIDNLTVEDRVTSIVGELGPRAECRLCEIPSARDGQVAGAFAHGPTIAVTPDSETLFVGLPSGMVEAWSLSERRLRFRFTAHKLQVSAISVSPDGKYLATGGLDNTTKLWEAATGAPLATYRAHNRPVWALAFSPDSRTLASGSCDKAVILCSVPLRRTLMNLWLYEGSPQGYEQEVRLLRFSPDGNVLAAALGDGTVRFFRAATFAESDRAATDPGRPR